MHAHRTLAAFLSLVLLACGDSVAETGATTGSADSSTSLPTTGDGPTTAGTTVAGTGDGSSSGSSDGSTLASTSSSETGAETSSSGAESTGSDETTADGTTTGGLLCGSDTSADPSPWSLARGVPDESLTTWWLGGGASSIAYMLLWEGALDLGGGPIDPGEGAQHIHIASHSTAGEFQWAEHIGGQSSEIKSWKAAMDCAGNIVVAGQFWGDISTQGVHLLATPGHEADEGMLFPTVDWFLMKFAPDGSLLWAQRFGDDRSQRLYALTLQSDGTIVVAGTVLGTLELGGEPIVAGEVVRKAALVAFTPDGAFAWQRSFESPDGVDLGAIAAGGDDRISVIAQTSGPVDLGGGVLPGGGEAELVAQFAADGGHLWSQRWQLATHKVRGVQTDAAGGAVFSGFYTVEKGEFILRHDGAGAFAWERGLAAGPDMDELVNIEGVLAGDEIVVAGGFIGTVDLGGGLFDSPPPLRSLFLARYDLAGGHLASEAHSATTGVSPRSLARGPDAELVIGGAFTGTLDLGGGPLQSVGESDLFVHRFAP